MYNMGVDIMNGKVSDEVIQETMQRIREKDLRKNEMREGNEDL